jgi:anti-sigma B factor antagonist
MKDVMDVQLNGEVYIAHLKLPHIDMFNVTELLEAFKPVFERHPTHIILNMEKTGFVDSSGMGGLIRIHQQVKGFNGNFYLANLSQKVNNLMRLTRSNQYLRCFDTLELALEAAR